MTGMFRKANQYALISLLIKEAEAAGQRLGKKALQKKIHLIQELGGVESGYRFSFYTYGPYSSQLSGDLDTIANSGGANIQYEKTENYYIISVGDKTDIILQNGNEFIEKNKREIHRVLEKFGGRLAKELELTSTIVYLRRHTSEEEFNNEEALMERVRALKPKYSRREIKRAIGEVKDFLDG